jgi:hypothetical protein
MIDLEGPAEPSVGVMVAPARWAAAVDRMLMPLVSGTLLAEMKVIAIPAIPIAAITPVIVAGIKAPDRLFSSEFTLAFSQLFVSAR